jgi:hypothetical protein
MVLRVEAEGEVCLVVVWSKDGKAKGWRTSKDTTKEPFENAPRVEHDGQDAEIFARN